MEEKVISKSRSYHAAQERTYYLNGTEQHGITAAHISQNEERKVGEADFKEDGCKI